MIVIDGVYINRSGGKILLEYFIKTFHKRGKSISDFFFLLDNRFHSDCLDLLAPNNYIKIGNTEKERSTFYKKNVDSISKVFCFANIPPPIYFEHIPVFILFHNVLILSTDKGNYGFKERFLFFLKRYYIKYRNHKNYQWIVQTAQVKILLHNRLNIDFESIKIFPFFDDTFFRTEAKTITENREGKFVYVAEGVSQKNHLLLLESWEVLAKKYGYYPELNLTVSDDFIEIIIKINSLIEKGIEIKNHGFCSLKKVNNLYNSSQFLVFPSLRESFGLPLVEAAYCGCEIIAADLPYVYEVVKPTATFNPYDSENMAYIFSRVLSTDFINQKTEVLVKDSINEIVDLILN